MKFQDEILFRLHEAIQNNKRFSIYEGSIPFNLKERERMEKIIQTEVVGHASLEAIVAASFAAPITAWLNIEQKGILILCFGIALVTHLVERQQQQC